MTAQTLAYTLLAAVLGSASSAPQYEYEPPVAPSNIYETPSASVQQPSQLYLTPAESVQQPPTRLYEAPPNNILEAQPQNVVPSVIIPPTTTTPPPNGPAMEGMPYDFTWDVEDSDSGNVFSHVETSDGSTTQGEYRVLLPNGRTQVVKFFDNGGGFNAVVTYE